MASPFQFDPSGFGAGTSKLFNSQAAAYKPMTQQAPQIGGFSFTGNGSQFGGASLPATPWNNPAGTIQTPSVQTGIGLQPNSIWNPQSNPMAGLQSRIGQLGSNPSLTAFANQQAMAGQNALAASGEKAQAGLNTAEQQAQVQGQNQLGGLMANMYGQGLENQTGQMKLGDTLLEWMNRQGNPYAPYEQTPRRGQQAPYLRS